MKTLLVALLLSLLGTAARATNERPTWASTRHKPFVRTEATHASIVVREEATRINVGVFKPQGHPALIRVTDARGETVKLEPVPRAHRSIRMEVELRRLADGPYDLTVEDHQGNPVQSMRVELQTGPGGTRRILAILFP